MKREKMRLTVLSALGLVAAAAAPARALLLFTTDQAGVSVAPGTSATLNIYLTEQPGSSIITGELGLFSAGLRVSRSNAPGDQAVLTAITPAANFDGTHITSVEVANASLYEDHASGIGPGALPDALGRVLLGTLTLTASSTPGQTTSFQISDDNALTSNTVTYLGTPLDDTPGIGSANFSVTAVLPDPSSTGLFMLLAWPLATRNRTCRRAI
jgi:hypothetical protein